jgi:SAM-dependent methyltransferase
MNPQTRFDDRAEDYAQYRPGYPIEAIAAILATVSDAVPLLAADIGAGTGISSRLLADQGVQVWAIEPNAAMRSVAVPHPKVTFHTGNAEQTGLPANSVDLVTCFQAFHWFDPERALPEFHRILKPTGQLAVVWNQRDRSNPVTAGYSRIVQQVSQQHPAEQRQGASAPLTTSPLFTNLRQLTFVYRQALDLTGLIGRAQSVSYIPKDDYSQRQLIAELTELYEQQRDDQGYVYLTYSTQVFLVAVVKV